MGVWTTGSYNGSRFRIEPSPEADSAFDSLSGKRPKKDLARIVARIERFANTGKLHAPGQINDEGDGFFAIKDVSGQLRAYCWYDETERGVVIISHFIVKKKDDLDPRDKAKMIQVRNIRRQSKRK